MYIRATVIVQSIIPYIYINSSSHKTADKWRLIPLIYYFNFKM